MNKTIAAYLFCLISFGCAQAERPLLNLLKNPRPESAIKVKKIDEAFDLIKRFLDKDSVEYEDEDYWIGGISLIVMVEEENILLKEVCRNNLFPLSDYPTLYSNRYTADAIDPRDAKKMLLEDVVQNGKVFFQKIFKNAAYAKIKQKMSTFLQFYTTIPLVHNVPNIERVLDAEVKTCIPEEDISSAMSFEYLYEKGNKIGIRGVWRKNKNVLKHENTCIDLHVTYEFTHYFEKRDCLIALDIPIKEKCCSVESGGTFSIRMFNTGVDHTAYTKASFVPGYMFRGTLCISYCGDEGNFSITYENFLPGTSYFFTEGYEEPVLKAEQSIMELLQCWMDGDDTSQQWIPSKTPVSEEWINKITTGPADASLEKLANQMPVMRIWESGPSFFQDADLAHLKKGEISYQYAVAARDFTDKDDHEFSEQIAKIFEKKE